MIEGAPSIERSVERIGKYEIEFSGFTREQRLWIINILELIKLPLGRVKKISYAQRIILDNDTDDTIYYEKSSIDEVSGTYNEVTQEIEISRYFAEHVAENKGQELFDTLIYEVSHSFNPTNAQREVEWEGLVPARFAGAKDQYPNKEVLKDVSQKLERISEQFLITKEYTGTFHRDIGDGYLSILEKVKNGEVSTEAALYSKYTLLIELHAMLIAILYEDPARLKRADRRCRKAYEKSGESQPYISIVDFTQEMLTAVNAEITPEQMKEVRKKRKSFARSAPF